MRTNLTAKALALGLAGAATFGAMTPASAAPVPTSSTAVKAAAPDQTTDVYWRRGGWGWGGPALAAGIIGGVALAATAPYYYGGYAPAYYPYAYAPAPAYGYGPYYGYRRAYVVRRPYAYWGGGPYYRGW